MMTGERVSESFLLHNGVPLYIAHGGLAPILWTAKQEADWPPEVVHVVDRKRYTEEFKIEAVRLMLHRGERTVTDVADALGVRPNQLHRWRQRYESAVRNPAEYKRESAEQAEIRRLKKQVEELRIEREILKKAAAFFAKESR